MTTGYGLIVGLLFRAILVGVKPLGRRLLDFYTVFTKVIAVKIAPVLTTCRPRRDYARGEF